MGATERWIEHKLDIELGKRKLLLNKLRVLEEENRFLKKSEEEASKQILKLTKELYSKQEVTKWVG